MCGRCVVSVFRGVLDSHQTGTAATNGREGQPAPASGHHSEGKVAKLGLSFG